jgi:hypothetical protein
MKNVMLSFSSAESSKTVILEVYDKERAPIFRYEYSWSSVVLKENNMKLLQVKASSLTYNYCS